MAGASGTRKGAMWLADYLGQNQPKVLGELETGYNTSQDQLGKAGDLYKGMTALGQTGVDKYGALTLGSGADIQKALEGTGGYQFNMDQGLQALQRNRAAQGMLGSGNTDTDAMTFASGLASNTLNSERAALQPYLGMYQQGIGGQAGVLGQQALGTTDYYGNRASVIDNTAKTIAGAGFDAFKAGDQAKAANQQMMLGALGTVAGLGGKLFGGGIGSGFTNMFSGGGLTSGSGGLY